MSSADSDNLAWVNGRTVPFDEAGLPLYDLGVVAGASVTIMMRTFGHHTFRAGDHLRRLLENVAELGHSPDFSEEMLSDAVDRVVERNSRRIVPNDDLGIVVFVTLGSNRTYLGAAADQLNGTVAIHTFRLPFELWRSAARDGVRLVIPPTQQVPSASLPTHLKTRNRLHWLLADRQAEAIAPGSKAILLNQGGLLTETSTANLFVVKDGKLLTPGKDVLPGMSREFVFTLAEHLGIEAYEADLYLDDGEDWSEAFLSSTPTCLLPVGSIADRSFSDLPGPVCSALLTEWSERVGLDVRRQLLGLTSPAK